MIWSGRRDSNLDPNLGKVVLCTPIASEASLERDREVRLPFPGLSPLSCLPPAYLGRTREGPAFEALILLLKSLIQLVGAAGFEPAT
jgi:hypothetical protein